MDKKIGIISHSIFFIHLNLCSMLTSNGECSSTMIHLSTEEDGDLGGTGISNEKDRTK